MESELDLAVDAIMDHCSDCSFNEKKQRWEATATNAKNIGYGPTEKDAVTMLYKIVGNVVRKRDELENMEEHEAFALRPEGARTSHHTTNIFNNVQGAISTGNIGHMEHVAVSVQQSPAAPMAQGKGWHDQRLSAIRSGKGQAPCKTGPLLIIHLIPVGPTANFDMEALHNHCQHHPRYRKGVTFTARPNQDGFLTIDLGSDYSDKMGRGYVQTFRDGKVESVRLLPIYPYNGKQSLFGGEIDKDIIFAVHDYLSSLQKLGATPPFQLFISLLNVKDFSLLYGPHQIDNEQIDLPEKIISEYPTEITPETVAGMLRDGLDILWNSSGQLGSATVNKDGSLKVPLHRMSK